MCLNEINFQSFLDVVSNWYLITYSWIIFVIIAFWCHFSASCFQYFSFDQTVITCLPFWQSCGVYICICLMIMNTVVFIYSKRLQLLAGPGIAGIIYKTWTPKSLFLFRQGVPHQMGVSQHLVSFPKMTFCELVYSGMACQSVPSVSYVALKIDDDTHYRCRTIIQFPHKLSHEFCVPWWRHQMETFSALMSLCVGNSPVPVNSPAQRPVTRSFGVFLDLCLNKWLRKQPRGW